MNLKNLKDVRFDNMVFHVVHSYTFIFFLYLMRK